MIKHTWLMWTGRLGGLLVTLLFGAFLLGQGWPLLQGVAPGNMIPLLLLMAIPFFGYFAAWQKPVSGGWMMIAGSLLMTAYFWYFDDWVMVAVYAAPALLIGLCFLASRDREMI
ncbi:MAG: hypothetical protein MUF29_06415 [Chitinophagaceae bacterium]|nr:hypothetical protein [Chitinophagaceae bacterium]